MVCFLFERVRRGKSLRECNGGRHRGESEEDEDVRRRCDRKRLEFKAGAIDTKTNNKKKAAGMQTDTTMSFRLCLLSEYQVQVLVAQSPPHTRI